MMLPSLNSMSLATYRRAAAIGVLETSPRASHQQQRRRSRRNRQLASSSSPTSSTTINNASVSAFSSRRIPFSNPQRARRHAQGYRERVRILIAPRSTSAAADDSSFLTPSTSATSSSSSSSKSRQPKTETTSSSSPQPPPSVATVVTGVAAVVATGVVNRLLYKASIDACGPRLALFLALLQASAPALIYSLVLALRVKTGATSRDELEAPATLPLLAVGAGEASSSVLGFLSASRIPGPALPMLAQSMLVWQMAFESVFLKRKQTMMKVAGAAMVVSGVCLAAWPAKSAASSSSSAAVASAASTTIPLGAALTYVFAQSFPAAAALAKEKIFGDAAAKLNSGNNRIEKKNENDTRHHHHHHNHPRQLDTFVVSARASVAQAAVVAALLPISALFGPSRVSSLGQLPRYLADGARAVAGLPSTDGLTQAPPGCPWLPLSYVAANVLFNVALLRLLRAAGAFVYSAGAALLVPAAIAAFSVRWPPFLFFGGEHSASALGPHFVVGAVVLVAGLGVVVASTSKSSSSRRRGEEEDQEEEGEKDENDAAADDDGDDGAEEQASSSPSLLSPPLLGDVGLETA